MNKVGAKSRDDGTNKADCGFYGVDRAKHGCQLSSSKMVVRSFLTNKKLSHAALERPQRQKYLRACVIKLHT